MTGAKEFGIAGRPPFVEFAQSQARKQKVVDQLWKGLQGLMKKRKITTFIGTGTLGPDHLVRVDDGTELVGDATSSWPPARCRAASPASTSTATWS